MYAKISNSGSLVEWPYDFAALQRDNPYTAFPPGEDVAVSFRGTETNLAGNYLVTVTSAPQPEHDPATQDCAQSTVPVPVGDAWVLAWTIVDKPPGEVTAQQNQTATNNKNKAQQLLQATDWVEIPSVTNTSFTPHLLNGADFLTYRVALRAIAVNPPDTEPTWPTLPTEQWST
jgi:hypothetical protein